MTDQEQPDPDAADHTRDRQDLGYEPEVLGEPVGGPVPEHRPWPEPGQPDTDQPAE